MSDDLTTLLKHSSPEVQALILEARQLIFKAVPGAQEKIYLGWRTMGYSATESMKDAFCAIDPQRTRINFVFYHGVDLPDPNGLLEGTGKHMRHVKIETPRQLHSRALKALIKAVVQFTSEA